MKCIVCQSTNCSVQLMNGTPKNEFIRQYKCEECQCLFETVESMTRLIEQKFIVPTEQQLQEKRRRLQELGLTTEEMYTLQRCEELACIEWLKEIQRQKGISWNQEEADFLIQLQQQTILPEQVINLIIYYVLLIRNRHYLHSGKTSLTVLRDWEQKKIVTAEQGFEQLKAHDQKIKNKGQRKVIRQETMPKFSKEEVLTEEEKLHYELEILTFMDFKTTSDEVKRWLVYKATEKIGSTMGELEEAFRTWRENQ
ncbi:DnaD domain protein [Enterococcus termitis]|uniref:DnaB/C C-terminal domain-containing protein n=2 Tax=Enterococcus termitis TaxID=332950 RepID=A0A1E5H4V9_9ENTE|nr:DnaD domain protein [Enterococcus termitis]OEG19998.1 hypothetical protein BCR25_14510 [Enterococcus termitis]